MMTLSKDNSETVLVLAPTVNDGTIACSVLTGNGLSAIVCQNAEELAVRLQDSCGAVVVAEEALAGDAGFILFEAIDRQEKWSDLPIILLTGPHNVSRNELFSKSGNISILERPFARLTLVQTVEVALRGRRRQYQIRDLLLEVEESRDEANRANAAKSQFLANTSHELRTPLNAIIGFSELIDDPNLTQEERHEFTATVKRNGRYLMQLMDDILDLSKVDAGKLNTERTKCHFPTILNDVKSLLSQQAHDKGIGLNFTSLEPVPEFITTDPMRLKQILLNIVGNAVKFTSQGTVEVTVQKIEGVSEKSSTLIFVVKDTGHGIAREQQPALFSLFTQANASISRKFGGTGLGLVLSRRLAEILGGTVELTHSEPGHGSTFTISIDPGFTEGLISLESGTRVISENDVHIRETTCLNGMKILVAEDSPDSRFLIDRILKSKGADVDLVGDGAEAIEQAQAGNYDVLLMDVQMPNIDGLQATHRLRAQGYQKPIIALTAHAMKEDRDKAIRAGCNDHMSKPINLKELIQIVQTQYPDRKGRAHDSIESALTADQLR